MLQGPENNSNIENSSLVNLEVGEWSLLNSSLKQHGLKSVSFMSFNVHDNPQEQWLLLDVENSCSLRGVIQVLIRDADRRQELVQDMIATNAHLREELNAQKKITNTSHDKPYSQTTNKKEEKGSGNKKKELERGMKEMTEVLEEVREELRVKVEEVEVLNMKLQCFIDEENAKRRRGENVMEKLQKRNDNEALNHNIICLIDMYEGKLMEVRKEMNTTVFNLPTIPQPTIHFKALIKSLERKLADGSKKNKELKEKCQTLQTELKSKEEQLANRKVEKVYIKENKSNRETPSKKVNTNPTYGRPASSLSLNSNSTRLVHLSSLPASQCHQYLETVCSKLGVCDLQDIRPSLDKLSKHSNTFSQLEMFIRDMYLIVTRYNLPQPPNKDCPCQQGQICSDRNCLLETLDFWVRQMRHLKELQKSLTNLSEKLFPWRPIKLDPKACSTLDLVDMVEGMAEEGCGGVRSCKLGTDVEATEKKDLVKVVKHFQQLFNVPQLSGVFAKMSYLYRRINEFRNFVTNIKASLNLDKCISPMDVEQAILRLRLSHETSMVGGGVAGHSEEIERVLTNLQKNDEFCGTSHQNMTILTKILGVESISQVVPSVKVLCNKLKRLTSHPESINSPTLSVLSNHQSNNHRDFEYGEDELSDDK